MLKGSKQHSLAHWSWWQVLAAYSFAFGVFGVLPGLMPPVSPLMIRLGLLFAAMVVAAALWAWSTFNWWARLAVSGLWTVQVLIIVARVWSLVIGVTWIWMVPIFSAYLLAWVLPLLKPRLSAILWREQIAPQTRLGRTILILALGIGPSAGVLGAAAGMFGNRFGERGAVLAVIGALGSFVAISAALAFSHQLWLIRPGAREGSSRTQ